MEHLKTFEGWVIGSEKYNDAVKKSNTIHQKAKDIKEKILSKLDTDPIDIYYIIDDYLLEFKDKFGRYDDKYDNSRHVLSFDDVDISVNLKDPFLKLKKKRNLTDHKSNIYTIATIDSYKWKGGKKIELPKAEVDISSYGGNEFDEKFCNKWNKNPEMKTFYSILIGIDNISPHSVVDFNVSDEEISDKAKELNDILLGLIKKLSQRYKTEIVYLEYINKDGEWEGLIPSAASLSSIGIPRRVSLGFTINKI